MKQDIFMWIKNNACFSQVYDTGVKGKRDCFTLFFIFFSFFALSMAPDIRLRSIASIKNAQHEYAQKGERTVCTVCAVAELSRPFNWDNVALLSVSDALLSPVL